MALVLIAGGTAACGSDDEKCVDQRTEQEVEREKCDNGGNGVYVFVDSGSKSKSKKGGFGGKKSGGG